MILPFSSLTKKIGTGGLLPIFGIMVFLLMSAGFATLGFILPSQISSSLDREINDRMLPGIRTAVEESSHAIKKELDTKRDATLARVKTAFTAQNEAKGKALIKTLLPLVENYDFDTAKQILLDAIGSDDAIAGIIYRLQADDKLGTIGDTSLGGLLPFKMVEKNSFADLEINLLVTPDQLAQAEEEEKSSFAKVERQMQEANQALEQQILEGAHGMQVNTVASLRIRIWLIAVVGVVLLVGITLLVMQRLVIIPLEKTKRYLLSIAEGDLTQDLDYHSNNELGEMAAAMNTMVANLRRIAAEINSSVAALISHADNLS